MRHLLLLLLPALLCSACDTDGDSDGPIEASADTGADAATGETFPCTPTSCLGGLRCDESGFCARPVAAELFAEGSADPRSGVGMANTFAPSLGSSEPDIAPLDCNGSGEACAEGFDCQAGGACTATCTACGGDCRYEASNYAIRNHISADLLYAGLPTGGNHHPCWAAWGEHTKPPGDERWVHNMEHGGVVFLYRCPDGCEAEVEQLRNYAATLPQGTWVLAPEPNLSSRFGVVAWGFKLQTDCFDLAATTAFYDLHEGNGPEATQMAPPAQCL